MLLTHAPRAGDLSRYLADPHGNNHVQMTEAFVHPADELGVAIAVLHCERVPVAGSTAFAVARQAQRSGASDTLVFDLLRVAIALPGGGGKAPAIGVDGLAITRLAVGQHPHVDISDVSVSNCAIEVLDLSEYEDVLSVPIFQNCLFGSVQGLASITSLPQGRFVDCEFTAFEAPARTTQGILQLSGLTDKQRVALTILKKIYAQTGAGRQEGALYRGLPTNLRAHVDGVLSALGSSNFVLASKHGSVKMYQPVRASSSRVRAILEAPTQSTDPAFLSLR